MSNGRLPLFAEPATVGSHRSMRVAGGRGLFVLDAERLIATLLIKPLFGADAATDGVTAC